MALAPYCEPNEVRATLGVNHEELSDTVLNLPIYEIGLVRDLNKVSPSLPAAFSVVCNLDEGSRSDIEKALYETTRLFCVYAAAKRSGVSLPILAAKDISDGKATLSRFADAPYKLVLERIDMEFQQTREALQLTLAEYLGGSVQVASATPATTFMAVPRLTDPVTGA